MKHFRQLVSCGLLVGLLAGCTSSSDTICLVTPDIFCPLYKDWESKLSPEARATLMGIGPDSMSKSSWQFEAGVRHDFGLWGDNETTRFFRAQSIDHPESMSGPVILGFISYLKGQRVDMVEIARPYAHLPTPPPPPPPA